VTGLDTRDVVYGAMAPDICQGILFDPNAKNHLANLTHAAANDLPAGEFATGFATHNGHWGGDHYAHAHHNPNNPPNYATRKILRIREEFDLSSQEGEGALDIVMDFLVRREFGPQLAELIVDSCHGGTRAGVLVDAFANPLAERVPGMSVETAERAIRQAAWVFRIGARVYGRQLAQDEETLRTLAAQAIRIYFRCDIETAQARLDWAIALCEDDYAEEMVRECEGIRARMASEPTYVLRSVADQ